MRMSNSVEQFAKSIVDQLSTQIGNSHHQLIGEISHVKKAQEKQALTLTRVETKIDEREKSFDDLRKRVERLEVSEKKRLYTLGKLAGLGGLAGAAIVKLITKLHGG
jgi:hypothetical protein